MGTRNARTGARQGARAGRALHHDLRAARSSGSTAPMTSPRSTTRATLGDPGEFPYTRGIHPDRLPRQALDDAPVRGVRDARGDQRPLQAAARRRRHRAERRVRPADADGPRPRPRAVARRGGEVRRQHRVARRHGDALRRHPARRHHDVDDDQLAGADALRDVPRRRRAAGRDWQTLSGTIQNDILKEFIAQKEYIYPPRPVDAAHHRHLPRSARREVPAVEHHLGQRLPHPRSGSDGRPGAGVHAARRDRVRAVGHRRRARRRCVRAAHLVLLQRAQRLLRGDCKISAPRGGSGRTSCASGSAPRTSDHGSCGFTRRRQACR